MNRKTLIKKYLIALAAGAVLLVVWMLNTYAPQADLINDSFVNTGLTAQIAAVEGETLPAGLKVYVGVERAEVTDGTISLSDTPAGVIGFIAYGPNGSEWKIIDPEIAGGVVDGINLEGGVVNEYTGETKLVLRQVEEPSAPEPTEEDKISPVINKVNPNADVIAIGATSTISFNALAGDGSPTLASNPILYYRESCDAADSLDKWSIARSQKENNNYKVELKPTTTADSCLEYIIEAVTPSGAGVLYPNNGIESGSSVPKILVRRPEAIGKLKLTAKNDGGGPIGGVSFEITDSRKIPDYIRPHLVGKKCVSSNQDGTCEIGNAPVLLGENSYIKVHPTAPAGYSSKYGDLWVSLDINGKTQTGGADFVFVKERNPTIISAAPLTGNIGSLISLSTKDISLGNDYSIKFGGVTATYQYSEYPYTKNEIKVAIPRGAKSGPVVLEQDGKTAIGPNITVNIVNAAKNSSPTITSILPKTVAVGNEITIKGKNFDSDAIVTFYPKGKAEVVARKAEIVSGIMIKALVPYMGSNQVKVGVQIGSRKIISSQIITVK